MRVNSPLVPLQDNVVVKKVKEGEQKRGEIYLPATMAEEEGRPAARGVVLAVGPGVETEDGWRRAEVELGQIVLFALFGTTDFMMRGEVYTVVPTDSLLGVVVEESEQREVEVDERG